MGFLLLENGDKLLLESGDRLLLEDGAPGGAAPTAPSGLTATAVSASAILLEWTDNSSDEDNFEVQRSADGSTGWTTVSEPTAVSVTDTGLAAETTYYYRVRAVNGYGNSSWSSTANATTLAEAAATSIDAIAAVLGRSNRLATQTILEIGE